MDPKTARPKPRAAKPAARRQPAAIDSSAERRGVGAAGVKAGLIGAAGMTILMLINLVSLPLLPCLVIPGFIMVLLVAGLLAGLLAGDRLTSSGMATQAGLAAGFVSGLGAAVVAIVLSVAGLMFADLGAGVRAQFGVVELKNLADMGISAEAIQTGGAVALAFVIWGIIGTLIAIVLGILGARLYYRLR
jgi:hypothetical protein